MQSSLYRPRAVIIHRDEISGFGLTVSGDNPVSIQTIKRGGAAECAGIREGEIIVKVNGTIVQHMNHTEVVGLILSAGPYVTLTLKPNDCTTSVPIINHQNGGGAQASSIIQQQQQRSLDRVTAPLPVDPDVQLQMQGNKYRTLQVYRDQAAGEVELKWKKFNESQNSKDKFEFDKAEKSLRSIEAQMKLFQQRTSQISTPTPFNPYPSIHSPVYYPGQQFYHVDIPPPLPPRSFNNTTTHHHQQHHHLPSYSLKDPMEFNEELQMNIIKQPQQLHHRAKSTPDHISMQKVLEQTSATTKRSDSVNDLLPCDSPPPPYLSEQQQQQLSGIQSLNILSMEDDDISILSTNKNPFLNLTKLLEHNSHLAVFITYVIDTKLELSSLLFYVITGLYIEEGTMKEMKRWGYEIHSCFTAPGAPLHIPLVDENIATEIDDSLLRESDREEMMRRVFRKARNKAKETINRQLDEFNEIKTAGLGTMYGPPENQLDESIGDKLKEQRIVEIYLLPRLEAFIEQYEKIQMDKILVIINGISTLLQRQFGLRLSNNLLEKYASFICREKSIRVKFMSSRQNKKTTFQGHHFTPHYYTSYTECNVCCKLLWGIGPQGLACLDCHVNTHRGCVNSIEHNCVPDQSAEKKNKLKQFKEKIRPKSEFKSSRNRYDEFGQPRDIKDDDDEDGPSQIHHQQQQQYNIQNEPRRSSAVGRSESCKERVQKKQTRERRKHSDPSLTKSGEIIDSAPPSSSSSNSSLTNNSNIEEIKSDIDWNDSDIDESITDWMIGITEDELQKMSGKEKKYNDVVHEIITTEKSYIRNLKIINKLFLRPIRIGQYLPTELILSLFGNFDELLDIHINLYQQLKINPINICQILKQTFTIPIIDKFITSTSFALSRQQYALRELKLKREKSQKLNNFLIEQESNIRCKRLQLQDMIPMIMQRLTKYPLMFENLLKYSVDENINDIKLIIEGAKNILKYINEMKKEYEDYTRLIEIQKKLDKSSLDKDKYEQSILLELKNLDVTKHKLIHEGHLHLRIKSQKTQKTEYQEVLLLLLHDMVVILIKQEDRYILKIHSNQMKVEKTNARPIIKLNNMIVRANASNKTAFMLINITSTNMYELVCGSTEERKTWLHHITRASEEYKSRQQESRFETKDEGDEHKEEEKESPPKLEIQEESDKSKDDSGLTSYIIITDELVSPSEVNITSNTIFYAQPVISQYEELKKLDSTIESALDSKLKLATELLHIPIEREDDEIGTSDVKQLVVACMQKVDHLGRILATQKITPENVQIYSQQSSVQQSLNNLLTQLLSEVHRKEEELETRRQELHRIREQNHGYLNRLMTSQDTIQSLNTTENTNVLHNFDQDEEYESLA